MNILPNEMFNNIKSNYLKKKINNKLLKEEKSRLDNKNSNQLINNSSALNLSKENSGFKGSYFKTNKKLFLKKEKNDNYNCTFLNNKSIPIKSLFFQRKIDSSSINKKVDINKSGNKRLTSRSSVRNLKTIKSKCELSPNKTIVSIINAYGSNKKLVDKNYMYKNLPFINISLNNK